jgi:hypothetical protein
MSVTADPVKLDDVRAVYKHVIDILTQHSDSNTGAHSILLYTKNSLHNYIDREGQKEVS